MSETTEKKTKKAKAPKAAKAEGAEGKRGRTSKFSGKTIHKLVKDNPRKPGSIGHASWELLRGGMTYEKYIEAGGRRQDLDFDLNKQYVELRG